MTTPEWLFELTSCFNIKTGDLCEYEYLLYI